MPINLPGGQRALLLTTLLRRRRSGPQFRSRLFKGSFSIIGVTRATDGTPIANCVVDLFSSPTDTLVAKTTSDGAGNYAFSLGNNSGTFYLVAYKPGGTDLFGTTVNTITAV